MSQSPFTRPVTFRRRIFAALLSLTLLSNAALAAPEAGRQTVVGMSEAYTDATFAWQNYYAGNITKLLPTNLSSFISAKTSPGVVRLEIFPKGVERIREGQPLDLMAVAY